MTSIVACLLALHTWLALSATVDLGVTGDETVHLTGGYSYWRFNDYRLHPENGNLPQRWAALPLLYLRPNIEPDAWPTDWTQSDPWMAGQHFFFESGNPIDYLLLWSRSAMMAWSIATGLLVFFWSPKLWGLPGALLSLGMYILSPTILAHAPLVTSDLCATFWMLAATAAWWRVTGRIDVLGILLSATAFGLALVAKFSSVVLLPIFFVIALWRIFKPMSMAVKFRRARPDKLVTSKLSRAAWLGLLTVLHAAAAVLIIWAFFGFRYLAFSNSLPRLEHFFSSFDAMLPPRGLTRWFLVQARSLHALPEAFLQGFCYVLYGAQERAAFAAGEYTSKGWWWFFPFAFLVKSSLAELSATVGIGLLALLKLIRRGGGVIGERCSGVIPLAAFATVYGAVMLASHLNIGQRHIFPLYVILFISAGALCQGPRTTSPPIKKLWESAAPSGILAKASLSERFLFRPSIVIPLVLGVACLESFNIRPHYLSFFNALAGGPEMGWRLLGDSSLDWGQNLPRLQRWLATHREPAQPIYLSYFGADDPFYERIRATELAPYFSFGRERHLERLEGGLYCIGASMLQDLASPYRGPWTIEREATYQKLRRRITQDTKSSSQPLTIELQTQWGRELYALERLRFARLCLYLRARSPDSVVANMIFIFRLSSTEVRLATDGTMTDLADAIEAAPSLKQDLR